LLDGTDPFPGLMPGESLVFLCLNFLNCPDC
jgi:hypothetical protein